MKTTIKELITDEQLDSAFLGFCFGYGSRRNVLRGALLKYACGYSTGHTIEMICKKLLLINKKCVLTKLGKQYLYLAYS